MKDNLFAKFSKYVNKKSNNKGSSVVLVLVTITFVGMLVAMSAYMSYYNWLAKGNDRQTKENFYTAEEAMNEISAGLQNVVSNAMTVAYSYALQNTIGASTDQRALNFEIMYEKQLIEQLKGSSSDHYNVDILKSYLKKTAWNDATQTGTKILTSNDPSMNENIIFKKDQGIVLQNVKVMHADSRGYVTYITTDIYLQLPKINLVASIGVPELENCAIIANDMLDVTASNTIKISGNVYGGKDGMLVSGDTALSFVKRESDPDTIMYHLVADSITVENSSDSNFLDVSKNYDVWTEQIFVESGNLKLKGRSYVRDDLTIEGRDSDIELAGSYYGYGNELYKSENSSSIIVNGGNTTLDFEDLSNLMLAGHAYIGASRYDPNTTTEEDYITDVKAEEGEEGGEESTPAPTPTYEQNSKDLVMGESIGVKSNQLMYMVPTECMGYYAGSSEQFLAKNPITYNEYLTLTTTYQYELNADGSIKKTEAGEYVYKVDKNGNKVLQYEEVNLGIIAKKVGRTLGSLGATYKPVFRKVNGNVLVYYYLDFTSERAANEFFKLYYDNDKENVDSYIKTYVSEMKLNPLLSVENSNLNLAGNAFTFNAAGEVDIVKDTWDEDMAQVDLLEDNRAKWYDTYVGYSKKMLGSTDLLTSAQLSKDIYDNLVIEQAQFDSIVPSGGKLDFTNGSIKAVAYNNRGGAPISLGFAQLNGVNLVIASGDVEINTDFNGLIICGGTVKLKAQCNIVTCDPVVTRKAMVATTDDGAHRVADLLTDGPAYTQLSAGKIDTSLTEEESKVEKEEDYIRLGDLIAYENWTKH